MEIAWTLTGAATFAIFVFNKPPSKTNRTLTSLAPGSFAGARRARHRKMTRRQVRVRACVLRRWYDGACSSQAKVCRPGKAMYCT